MKRILCIVLGLSALVGFANYEVDSNKLKKKNKPIVKNEKHERKW